MANNRNQLNTTEGKPKMSTPNCNFLHLECIRRQTFVSFPWRFQTRESFAESGFYYDGVDDVVTCFACGVQLRNWKPCESIQERHRLFRPKCPLACGDFSTNIPISEIKEMRPVHGQFHTPASRIASFERTRFDDWNQPLAKAGYFYDATKDAAVCHYCDSILSAVKRNADILELHRKENENCDFLKAITPRIINKTPRRHDECLNHESFSLRYCEDFAKAGFCYRGVGDTASCFECDFECTVVALKDRNESVRGRHLAVRPNCPVALGDVNIKEEMAY